MRDYKCLCVVVILFRVEVTLKFLLACFYLFESWHKEAFKECEEEEVMVMVSVVSTHTHTHTVFYQVARKSKTTPHNLFNLATSHNLATPLCYTNFTSQPH